MISLMITPRQGQKPGEVRLCKCITSLRRVMEGGTMDFTNILLYSTRNILSKLCTEVQKKLQEATASNKPFIS
jgi:hypothetical protein